MTTQQPQPTTEQVLDTVLTPRAARILERHIDNALNELGLDQLGDVPQPSARGALVSNYIKHFLEDERTPGSCQAAVEGFRASIDAGILRFLKRHCGVSN